ncbi:MAG: hypothetical protein AAF196_02930 [Planctomycetota bacterium]
MSRLQIIVVQRGPERRAHQGSAPRGSVAWTEAIGVDHDILGDPGDDVVFILHCNVGAWEWRSLPGQPPPSPLVAESAFDVVSTGTYPGGFYESVRWIQDRPQDGSGSTRDGLSVAYMVRATLVAGGRTALRTRIGYGPFPSQQVGLQFVQQATENATITAINLTRATSQGIAWHWADNYGFPLPTTLSQFDPAGGVFSTFGTSILPPLDLDSDAAKDRNFLAIGAPLVAPGNVAARYATYLRHRDPFGSADGMGPGVRQSSGPVGTRGRSQSPDNSESIPSVEPMLIAAGMFVPAGEQGHRAQLEGYNAYVVGGGNRAGTAAGALFAIDLEPLNGQIVTAPGRHNGNSQFPEQQEFPVWGPVTGEPNADDVDNRADVEAQSTEPSRKLVLFFAAPRNEVSPSRYLSFATFLLVQDETLVDTSTQQNPIFPLSLADGDAMPIYEASVVDMGRGGISVTARGVFNDENGGPSRIPEPWRSAFESNALCFVTCDLQSGIPSDFEEEDPRPGPPVYVVPNFEAPVPSNLPEFPYVPDEGLRLEPQDVRGTLEPDDGRLLTWGLFMEPGRRIERQWTLSRPMVDVFRSWLENLDAPLVRHQIEPDSEPRAWLITGELREEVVDSIEGHRRMTLALVEVLWTQEETQP